MLSCTMSKAASSSLTWNRHLLKALFSTLARKSLSSFSVATVERKTPRYGVLVLLRGIMTCSNLVQRHAIMRQNNETIFDCASKLSKRIWVGWTIPPMASGLKFQQRSKRTSEGAPKVFRSRNSQRFIMEINSTELQKAASASNQHTPEIGRAHV